MIDGQNGLIRPSTSFLLSPRQLKLLAWYAQGHVFILRSGHHIYFAGILTRDSGICGDWRSSLGVYHYYLGVGDFNTCGSQTAKDFRASQDTLLDVFERIEMFFRRLEICTEVPLTSEMTTIIIRIMAEVISILGIATKDIKQGQTSE